VTLGLGNDVGANSVRASNIVDDVVDRIGEFLSGTTKPFRYTYLQAADL
jgi:hypothetical protein